jgi:hypothetical protein
MYQNEKYFMLHMSLLYKHCELTKNALSFFSSFCNEMHPEVQRAISTVFEE